MIGTLTLIGVGLIGGSLSLALKQAGKVKRVIGVARSEETLLKARSLGLIDVAETDAACAVSEADIVVLCTPLSSYDAIVQTVGSKLKSNVILTDVGSVKQGVSVRVHELLPPEHRSNFVPGHPIAGTEKSGPEAAFAELYRGKQTYLTPLEDTATDAVNGVTAMWQAVGAEVEHISPERHDYIYAVVSHLPQLVSTVFACTFAEQPEPLQREVQQYADENFKKFIRLAGSNAAMWRDIFAENADNVQHVAWRWQQDMALVAEYLECQHGDVLSRFLKDAWAKRRYFHDLLYGRKAPPLVASDYSGASAEARLWLEYLPRVISAVTMEGIPESEYVYATGAGLHGVTRNVLLQGGTETKDLLVNGRSGGAAIGQIIRGLTWVCDLMQSNPQAVEKYIMTGQKVYEAMQDGE